MPVLAWNCALGEANPATLPCASTVALGPPGNSVDTNAITITGNGTINSFGICQDKIMKRVMFSPSGGNIVLANSAALALLSGANRTIANRSFGTYQCNGDSIWTETYFHSVGVGDGADLEARIVALEALTAATVTNVNALFQRMSVVETRCTSLENRCITLEGRCTALEGRATTLEAQYADLEQRVSALEP